MPISISCSHGSRLKRIIDRTAPVDAYQRYIFYFPVKSCCRLRKKNKDKKKIKLPLPSSRPRRNKKKHHTTHTRQLRCSLFTLPPTTAPLDTMRTIAARLSAVIKDFLRTLEVPVSTSSTAPCLSQIPSFIAEPPPPPPAASATVRFWPARRTRGRGSSPGPSRAALKTRPEFRRGGPWPPAPLTGRRTAAAGMARAHTRPRRRGSATRRATSRRTPRTP
mmetsp:Transcript_25966/g.54061  ORF Transcript_25966/g.54061 Transcript_25966/m.54061 type:complete len:220 (+) Transcript_25966:167-826(+)